MRPNHRRRPSPVLSVLALAVLGAISLPAFASDDPCRNPDGSNTSPPPSTSQRSEGGSDNTTCRMFASAFGQYNNASGDISNAFGWENNAWNEAASAFGAKNVASGAYSNAFGYQNTAGQWESSAFGVLNSATGVNSSASGHRNSANGQDSSAFGDGNLAAGDYSNAFGLWSYSAKWATALGLRGYAAGTGSVALAGFFDRNGNGHEDLDVAGTYSTETAVATGTSSVAVGAGVQATASVASAVGVNNLSSASGASTFGIGNTASGLNSTAIGSFNAASGQWGGVFGYGSQALNTGGIALGYQAIADRDYAIAVGKAGGEHQIIHLAAGTADTDAVNVGQLNAAIAGAGGYGGWSLSANGGAAKAIGSGETVDFKASDANGNLTVSRSGNTITYGFAGAPTFTGLTVGGAGGGFTIVNNTIVNMGGNVVAGVANGVAATDAVNKGQLDAGLAAANGNAVAAQATANSALAAAGTAQTTANQAVAGAAAAQSTANNALTAANAAQATADTALATATTAQATADTAVTKADAAQATANNALATANNAVGAANAYTDSRETAIRTDLAAGDAQVLSSANAHADAGDAATLTASRSYTDAKSASTLTAANAYTDAKLDGLSQGFDRFRGEVNQRFYQTDRHINQMSSMATAMTQMSANAVSGGSRNGRVAVGFGVTSGQKAISVGYGVRVGRGSVSFGAAFSGGKGTAGAGFGLDL